MQADVQKENKIAEQLQNKQTGNKINKQVIQNKQTGKQNKQTGNTL